MLLQRLTGNPLVAGSLTALLLIIPQGQLYLLYPLQLILPLPIYLVAMRSGIKAGILAAMFPIFFCLGFMGTASLPLVLVYGMLIWFPLLAAWLLGGGWKPGQVLAGGYFLGLLLLVAALIVSLVSDSAIQGAINDQFTELKELMLAALEKLPATQSNAGLLLEAKLALEETFRLIALLFPGLFFSSWFTIQGANLLLVWYLLNHWKLPLMVEQDLLSLRVPFLLIWLLIGFGLLAILFSGFVQQLALNLVLFLVVPYLFQGYFVIQKAFQHFKTALFVRVIFYVLLLTWSAVLFTVLLLGIFDTWANFRKRMNGGEGSFPL